MWRAILVKYLLRLRCTRDLIAQLRASRQLRRLCGFRDAATSEYTFSRFIARLVQHHDLVYQAVISVANTIGDALALLKDDGLLLLPADTPKFGRTAAIDSTDISAYANPRRTVLRDTKARLGYRTAKADTFHKDSSPWLGQNCASQHYESWDSNLLRKVGQVVRASRRGLNPIAASLPLRGCSAVSNALDCWPATTRTYATWRFNSCLRFPRPHQATRSPPNVYWPWGAIPVTMREI